MPKPTLGWLKWAWALIPAGGGTKEALLRNTQEAARAGGDLLPGLSKAWEGITKAKISTSSLDAVKLGYLSKADTMVMSLDYLLDEAKQQVLHMAGSGFRCLPKEEIKVSGATGRAALQYKIELMKNGNFHFCV